MMIGQDRHELSAKNLKVTKSDWIRATFGNGREYAYGCEFVDVAVGFVAVVPVLLSNTRAFRWVALSSQCWVRHALATLVTGGRKLPSAYMVCSVC